MTSRRPRSGQDNLESHADQQEPVERRGHHDVHGLVDKKEEEAQVASEAELGLVKDLGVREAREHGKGGAQSPAEVLGGA